ncbi:transcription initiation factor TFIIE-like protein [Cladorrhinum sp. PSN259]|nr:transcription initiation factor TFIIE-like protein [Cladorrhinum sp. PSN259]
MDTAQSLAQTLVRSVVRAFYTTNEILVVDALVTHSALRDDDLAYLMKMNLKDLHRLCAGLRDARFLVVFTRPEMQEGKTRPINRTYYYIDYQQTIDAIKWRIHKIDKDMQGIAQPQDESKEYFCPHCKAQWTQLEVLDSVGPAGFTCQRCSSVLERSKEEQAPGHQQLSRMNNQFKFMTDLLQKIDRSSVAECNFDKAYAIARPIVREATHEALASVPVDMALNKPSAVKGLANTGPKTMQVTISDGNDEAEHVENRKRKERLAKENALPSWITDSSIKADDGGRVATQSFEMKDAAEEGYLPAKRVKLADGVKVEVGIKGEPGIKVEDDDDDDIEFEDVV